MRRYGEPRAQGGKEGEAWGDCAGGHPGLPVPSALGCRLSARLRPSWDRACSGSLVGLPGLVKGQVSGRARQDGQPGLISTQLLAEDIHLHLPDLSSVLHSSKCTDFGDFTTCCLINYLIFRLWVSINSSGFSWYRIMSPVRTNGFISFSPLCNTNANRVVCYLHHNVKVNEGVFVFFLHLD